MTQTTIWWDLPFSVFTSRYPQLIEWLAGIGLSSSQESRSLRELLDAFSDDHFEDIALSKEQILSNLASQLEDATDDSGLKVQSLTIQGGQNKAGEPESIKLDLIPGEVTCIVGPTGSGKSYNFV